MALDKGWFYTLRLGFRARLMRRRWVLLACFSGLLAGRGSTLASPPPPPISGIVSHLRNPIADALVISYNLGDTSLTRSRTAPDGTFVLASSPSGVYDLIAYKKGFLPALVRLWHQALSDQVSSVHIQLASQGTTPDRPTISSIWELRDRLPADVLRELTMEESAGGAGPLARIRAGRIIGGEVATLADFSSGDSSLARTAVGLRGGLPNGWKYDLRGDYATVPDSPGNADTTATGSAAGVALDVATSPEDQISLTTRRHTLSFRQDGPASLSSQAVGWSRGSESGSVESVAARYMEEVNLFRATSLGTSLSPLASRTWEVKTRYQRPAGDSPGVAVVMTYRRTEGTPDPSGVGPEGALLLSGPDADLSASASWKPTARMQVDGGVLARYVAGGYGVAPRLSARYELGDQTYVFVQGFHRATDPGIGATMALPLVVSIEENREAMSRKGFVVGFERASGEGGSFHLEASSQRVGEAVRAFFGGDFLTDFDSLYLFDGNGVRQYQAAGSQRLTDTLAGSLAARYGSIDGEIADSSTSTYGISSNRGYFWSARAAVEVVPTRTGVAILVRRVRQELETPGAILANDSDKIALSVAQDLSVVGVSPFGSVCKLLIALESARSTVTADREEPASSNRLLGGVAISF
ncbi:MAG: carboxypeptidase-like regulatory domain-containing protein [Thermoanaerobaculia bacterium]